MGPAQHVALRGQKKTTEEEEEVQDTSSGRAAGSVASAPRAAGPDALWTRAQVLALTVPQMVDVEGEVLTTTSLDVLQHEPHRAHRCHSRSHRQVCW